MKRCVGFTLIELVAIILIIGTLGISVGTRLMPSSLHQLQAAKQLLLTALFTAQQKSMTQLGSVQVSIDSGIINFKIDGLSVRTGGTSYPLTLPAGVTATEPPFSYDRVGHTQAKSITLTKGSDTVTVTITGTGYAY